MAARPRGRHTAGLTHLLAAELNRMPTTAGLYVKHLKTGEEAGVREDELFEGASTIKVPIMLHLYDLADRNEIDLGERMEITASDFVGGSGVFRYHGIGLNPSLRDLITQMIITSDNVATDMLLRRVGGVRKINACLKRKGFHALRANRTTFDYFRQMVALVDRRLAKADREDLFAVMCGETVLPNGPRPTQAQRALAKAFQEKASRTDIFTTPPAQLRKPANWFSVVTPREMGAMLEGIERRTIASAKSCEDMKRILLNTQASGSAVAGALKLGVDFPVGYKRGGTIGVTNDVGIVYAGTGPIVISFYTMDARARIVDVEWQMGNVTRMVVEYFGG